jgi:hypothetical protein
MKQTMLIILIGMLVSVSVIAGKPYDIEVLMDEGSRIQLEFDLHDYEIERVFIYGDPFTKITIPGHIVTFLTKGFPELPKFAASIVIPDEGVMSYKIVDIEYEIIKADPIVPSKGNLKRNVDPEDVPYIMGDFYFGKKWFPENSVEISDPYILRDFRGVTVRFHPFQYEPSQGILKIAKRIVVEIFRERAGGTSILERKRDTISEPFTEIYKNFFLNFASARSRYPLLSERVGNMLIITADGYHSYLDDFVYWKKLKGIPVGLVDVSTIGNTSTDIKNYIQNKYDTEGVTWVLLVGNESDVTTIAGSYDATCDPVYAYLSGSDNYLDAFICRFSGNNATHIENQVARSVQYERNPPQGATWNWYHRACGTATNEGSPDDCERLGWVNDTLLSYTYTSADQWCQPSATNAQILGAIDAGRSILNHIGHGSRTGFGTNGGFWIDIDDIASLTNTDMLPFVYLVACLTGDFDAVTTCCCEAWVWDGTPAAPQGGIGAYGASVLQSWVPPTLAQLHGNGLLKREEAVTMGGITYNGAMYMLDQTGDLEMLETWHIFGDASIDLRTDIPDTFEVTHPSIYQPGSSTFSVSVLDNNGVTPIEDALVCLWIPSETPELHTANYTDVSGNVTFDISPSGDGAEMFVTVTKHNYGPYEGYATLASGAPSMPTLYNLFEYARDFATMPALTFASTDTEGNQIEYEVSWDTDPGLSSPSSGMTGLYNSGDIASFTFASPLTDGETYYWRVRGRDPSGSNFWGPYSEIRSFTIGTILPSGTCSWYQTDGNQFGDDLLADVLVEGDSVVLPTEGGVSTDTILEEDFESGLPDGWTVIDGNGDNYEWTTGTTGDIGSYTPPSYGSRYAYYSDDDAGDGVINTNEELLTPSVYIQSGTDSLEVRYGWGFRRYENGERMDVRVRFFNGGWGGWNTLVTHNSSGSGTAIINLSSYLPADSVQVNWIYNDEASSSHWSYACATDNIYLITKTMLSNTDGTITGTPVAYEDLASVYARTSWGSVTWDKSATDDSISIQVEYLSGGVWDLVPNSDLPGNSSGFFTTSESGAFTINGLSTTTYDTLRLRGNLYRKPGRASDDPSLLAWEVGNLSELAVFLMGFDASGMKGKVKLFWRTESEIDNAYWLVERGVDPQDSWQQITMIEGQGTKPAPTEYEYIDAGMEKDGQYYYRLIAVNGDGERTVFGPVSAMVRGKSPRVFALHKPSPNPCSGRLALRYDVPKKSFVNLKVYNVIGQVVRTLVHGNQEPDYYQVIWDGKNDGGKMVGFGVYFVRLETDHYIKTHKLLLVK